RGRALALRGLRVSGARGQSAIGEAPRGPAPRARRIHVRLPRRGRALDSRPAAALLDARGLRRMSEPFRRRKVQCASASGLHRMAYLEWGDPESAKTLLCVHGLTRCARDFDFLAPEMARHGYRVVCPDVAGRGDSDWLKIPMEYTVATYAFDMVT